MALKKKLLCSVAAATIAIPISVSSLPTSVNAESCFTWGNSVYCSDGFSGFQWGNTFYGNDGYSAFSWGNSTYGNDGFSSFTGNSTYGNDGYSFFTWGIHHMAMMVSVLSFGVIQFTEIR